MKFELFVDIRGGKLMFWSVVVLGYKRYQRGVYIEVKIAVPTIFDENGAYS